MSKSRKILAVTKSGPKSKIDTEEFLALYYGGWKETDIAKKFGVTKSAVSKRIKALGLVPRENFDITNYDNILPDILKNKVFEAVQQITPDKYKNASLAMLGTFIATIIDKIRLLEGKSTENIAAQAVHSLDPETRKLLQEAIANRTRLKLEEARQ